eukprot:CAMPEP_0181249756 /NCGR_PEP_ID=MMETSP1096-20121128/45940_1 /TAXON_ID=156174 ORGANISM="Chrysochromulina ericina, Strain CCMP281" /NCGR_SAMPLE_ID=MMETSP1096 /ASSEMBLY_ACC=CAM_ASM_000453 /LENGTH=100 /DNA_ID=CAMNT_0023347147 /DNA_START=139 /DNA_END=442 /DNA_ORIENTATION=-
MPPSAEGARSLMGHHDPNTARAMKPAPQMQQLTEGSHPAVTNRVARQGQDLELRQGSDGNGIRECCHTRVPNLIAAETNVSQAVKRPHRQGRGELSHTQV